MSQPTNFHQTSLSSTGHFFHRGGIQQSPTTYSPLLSSQAHTLYNGVLGSHSGFPPQNNFSTSSFNSYTHVDAPLWLPDTRVTSTVTNVPLINVGRNNRQLYSGKDDATNIQNVPQTCCVTQSSPQKSSSGNLQFSSDSFKGLDKEVTFPIKAVANIDPQSWYCGQSVVSYGNQQNENVQQSYKCVEQFSSCLVAQNMLLHEQSTTKQTNVSFSNVQSCSLEQKDEYCTKFSARPMCLEQDKKQPSKYYDQNTQIYGQSGYTMHGKQSDQQQECYSNQSVFGSSSDMYSPLSAEGLYSQASLFLHVNNDNQLATKSQTQSSNQKQLHFSNFPENCKTFSPSEGQLLTFQHFQEHDKNTVDMSVTCGIDESNVQHEAKPVTAEVNAHPVASEHRTYEQVAVVGPASRCNNSYGMGELVQICSSDAPSASQEQLHLPDCDDGTRNKETSSIAGESDIIVEETEEEDVSESEISVDESTIKSSCLVCDAESTTNQLVYVNQDIPVTSSSHTPVAARLVQTVARNELSFKFHTEFMCRRCLNLIETIDSLETKLTTVKDKVIELLGPKLTSLQSAPNLNPSGTKNIEIKKDGDQECKLDEQSSFNDMVDTAHVSIHKDSPTTKDVLTEICDPTVSINSGLSYKPVAKECEVVKKKCDEVMSNVGVDSDETVSKNDTKFFCETCGEYFCSKEYLTIHQQQHTKQYTHFCKECDRGFMTQYALDSHVLLHTGVFQFQCDRCGKQFCQRYSLENHMHRHEGKFQFVCSICTKGFVSKHALQIHLRLHTGDCPFMCEHCGRQFKCASNLTVHVRSCSGEFPYHCKKCNKKYTLKAHLHAHIAAKHGSNARFKCSLCSKGFSKNSDFVSHMKSHTKEKLHKCKICGKCYSSISNLNQHSKIHFEDKLYKCDICTKNFKRKSTLVDHINQHKGLKLYKCDSCKKTFVSQRSFQAHQKWHAGTLKCYTCKVCGKTMFSGLSVHMLTHTQQKPHSCVKCGALFSVRSSLNKHIRQHCKKL